jgi:hypothetical protein
MCLQWDSNPQSLCMSGLRQLMLPGHCLWCVTLRNQHKLFRVGFEVLTAVVIKVSFFRDIEQCSP